MNLTYDMEITGITIHKYKNPREYFNKYMVIKECSEWLPGKTTSVPNSGTLI
jgi:hypothetical protein